MGWGCLVTQRFSPGHAPTVRPRRRLPAPLIADGVGLQSANRERVQVFRGLTGGSRRRGLVRARRCEVRWRLRALMKAGVRPQGDDDGPTTFHLLCSNAGKRDAGVSLAAGAESAPQSTARPGGSGPGVVTCSSAGGQSAALLTFEHVHLSNNRLKLTVRGRPTRTWSPFSRAAA